MKFLSTPGRAHRRTLVLALALVGCASGSPSGPSSEDCSDACAQVGAADCGDIGAECVSSCVHSTQVPVTAVCASELFTYANCFWAAGSYTCDASHDTTAPACSAQHDAYQDCLNGDSGGAGAGGAGGAPDDVATSGAGGA